MCKDTETISVHAESLFQNNITVPSRAVSSLDVVVMLQVDLPKPDLTNLAMILCRAINHLTIMYPEQATSSCCTSESQFNSFSPLSIRL